MLVEKKSCEKTAIPLIIDTLDLKNDIVTIDAAGTMTHVAAAIVDKKGDYILALKKNNKLFYNEVLSFFYNFEGTTLIKDVAQTADKQGLRTDIRTCSIITDLQYFPDAQAWKNLKTLVLIKSQRTHRNDKKIKYQSKALTLCPKKNNDRKIHTCRRDPDANVLCTVARKRTTALCGTGSPKIWLRR